MSYLSKSNRILLYPLVPACFPVAFLYAQNSHEVLFDEFIVSLGIVLIGTLAITICLRLFVQDNVKVVLLMFILVALLFFVGPLQWIMLQKLNMSAFGVMLGHSELLLVGAAIVGSIVSIVILKFKGDLTKLVTLIVVISVLLVIFNCFHILIDRFLSSPPEEIDYISDVSVEDVILPDIYYIVLDAYGRSDKLLHNMGYDNEDFINSLTDQKFFVARESRSNYTFTLASLGSSLSMRYLTPEDNVISLIKSNHIARLLQSLGYQYVHIDGSAYGVTKGSKLADLEYNDDPFRLLFNDFSFELFEPTLIFPIFELIGVDLQMRYWYRHGRAFNSGMDALQTVPEIKGPTFTFLHSFPPRQPFIFDRSGGYREEFRTYVGLGEYNELYLDQLSYVNKKLSVVVENILRNSEGEPVIILQGDHGPKRSSNSYGTIDNPTDSYVDERSAILNAYYLPDSCDVAPYHDITPVNTFRLVLNSCLGSDVHLLDDYSYWFHRYKDQSASPIDFGNNH